MSVITRMLRDLEARDAAQPRRTDNEPPRRFSPGPERRPHRRGAGDRLRRAGAAGLAAGLLAVAVALWWQRGPHLWAILAPTAEDAPPAARAASLPQARLAAIHFRGTGREALLELSIDGDPADLPAYSRRGSTVTLRVPAPAPDLQMRAPPKGQQVFRSALLQREGDATATVRLDVAESASFDLERAGGRLTLRGRLPLEPPNSVESQAPVLQPSPARLAEVAEAAAPPANDREPRLPEAASTTGGNAAGAVANSAASGAKVAAPGGDGAGEAGARGLRKHDDSAPTVRAQRRHREAQQAFASGDLGEGRRLLRRALALDPDLHAARDLLAALLRRAGDPAAARDVLGEGVRRAPARPEYATPYARLLVDAGELERAARVLQAAAAAARDDADFHALRGAVASRRGRHAEAARSYTRALELDAANGRWWLGLGVALAAAERPSEALAAFREARRTGSLSPRLDAWARGRMQALAAAPG